MLPHDAETLELRWENGTRKWFILMQTIFTDGFKLEDKMATYGDLIKKHYY